jgi:hypothetical protein
MVKESLFSEYKKLSLKELYNDAWDDNYDDDDTGDGGITGSDHQSIRYCDLYWLALATKTNHKELYEKYQDVTLPQDIQNGFLSIWLHANFPIMSMSLRQVMDTLFGLEWFALCELFRPQRDLTWVKEMQNLTNIVRYRLYYLATRSKASSLLLDMDDGYTEEVSNRKRTTTAGSSTKTSALQEEDYYSDEEKKKVIKYRRNLKTNWADRMIASATKGTTKTGDTEGSYAPSNIVETQRKTTWVLAHDANCTLRELDRHLNRYLELAPYVTWHSADDTYNLAPFRQHCAERLEKFEALIPKRKQWQYEMQCLPSHRAIYQRVSNKPFAQPNEILASKLFNLVNMHMPKSLEEMIAPNATVDSKAWLRVNTDFLFELLSSIQKDEGDVFDYLVRQKIFFRLRIGGKWIVMIDSKPHGFDSFTHGFVFYRRYQKAQKMSHFTYLYENTREFGLPQKVDLSQFDSYLAL